MKRLVPLLVVSVLVCLAACAPPQYTKDDLVRLGARETTGVVSKSSRGSFKIIDDAGVERHLRTSQQTQYIPENYRSMDGDRVRVAFQELMQHSGLFKLSVLQLEALEISASNQSPPSPQTGTLAFVDKLSWIHFRPDGADPSSSPLLLRVRGDTTVTLKRADALPTTDVYAKVGRLPIGAKIRVDFVREPILRGNGYYYKLVGIQEL